MRSKLFVIMLFVICFLPGKELLGQTYMYPLYIELCNSARNATNARNEMWVSYTNSTMKRTATLDLYDKIIASNQPCDLKEAVDHLIQGNIYYLAGIISKDEGDSEMALADYAYIHGILSEAIIHYDNATIKYKAAKILYDKSIVSYGLAYPILYKIWTIISST